MSEIVISEIQIVPVKPHNGLIAFASCVINSQIYLSSIAIYSRPDGSGYRLLYPTKTLSNGTSLSLFHPINRECGRTLEEAIVQRYQELLEESLSRRKG
jgi:stage V sporulation protein G